MDGYGGLGSSFLFVAIGAGEKKGKARLGVETVRLGKLERSSAAPVHRKAATIRDERG